MSLRADSINFEAFWPSIESLLLNILNHRYNNISKAIWQETFFDVYKVCVAPESLVGNLYDKLKNLIQEHVKEVCRVVANDEPGNLLSNYYNQWVYYKDAAEYLDRLFNYLNTHHLRKIKKPMHHELSDESVCHPGYEVNGLCLFLWYEEVVKPLKVQMVRLLIHEIESDRKGMSVNQTIIKGVIHSLADVQEYKKEDTLELYREAFEKPFLKCTGEYYKIEADRYRDEFNCSDYMKKVLHIIDMETLRCTKFIHSSSKDKVISEIRARMVADHIRFLHKESEQMVASNSWQDLNSMYKLLKPMDGGLKTLIQQVQSSITATGLESIESVATSQNPPKEFVDAFISFHREHHKKFEKYFNNDQLFGSALDKACSAIVNHRINPDQPCRSPELLSKYCDSLLRRRASERKDRDKDKSQSQTDIDEQLTRSIIIFKYIDDKDIFQKFYSKNMARRLIFSQLVSMEAEELMINKLKQVCGYEFTAKLHRMFTDIGVSTELKDIFSGHLKSHNVQLGISFSIYVLQAGSWPLGQSPVTSSVLPEVLSNSVRAFEDFYYSRFNGRVLTWLYHHSTADLKLCYTAKRQYSVSMQTFHATILLLYEKNDELTYEQISKATQLSDDQLNKHLQGLLETKILNLADVTSEPGTSQMSIDTGADVSNSCGSNVNAVNTKDNDAGTQSKIDISDSNNIQQYSLNPKTKIRLNLDFTSPKAKFKIAVVQRDTQYQQVREQNESEQTHSSIDEDRKLYIQAAIVRVMKSRKSSKHNQLIQEVIGLTKNHFTPSVPMIKKCIEILIEKQYLERKVDASDEYKYVA